jgi:hypothetical protein
MSHHSRMLTCVLISTFNSDNHGDASRYRFDIATSRPPSLDVPQRLCLPLRVCSVCRGKRFQSHSEGPCHSFVVTTPSRRDNRRAMLTSSLNAASLAPLSSTTTSPSSPSLPHSTALPLSANSLAHALRPNNDGGVARKPSEDLKLSRSRFHTVRGHVLYGQLHNGYWCKCRKEVMFVD